MKLDTPLRIGAKTNPALWLTVAKDGVRYNLQVFLDGERLEEDVARLIEANRGKHQFEAHNSHVRINLVKQS